MQMQRISPPKSSCALPQYTVQHRKINSAPNTEGPQLLCRPTLPQLIKPRHHVHQVS
jgi:hypothetical protein